MGCKVRGWAHRAHADSYPCSSADGTNCGTPLGANCSGVGITRTFRTALRTLRDIFAFSRFTGLRARVFLTFLFEVFADVFFLLAFCLVLFAIGSLLEKTRVRLCRVGQS
jgi:hypothetical protein